MSSASAGVFLTTGPLGKATSIILSEFRSWTQRWETTQPPNHFPPNFWKDWFCWSGDGQQSMSGNSWQRGWSFLSPSPAEHQPKYSSWDHSQAAFYSPGLNCLVVSWACDIWQLPLLWSLFRFFLPLDNLICLTQGYCEGRDTAFTYPANSKEELLWFVL